ncbi:MAG: ATP-binding cassette domain-containing protein [Muribaculaceae bacterium]|nr:ATP-binding cassette domain-containing protein [Muribaculaceae bacterium]
MHSTATDNNTIISLKDISMSWDDRRVLTDVCLDVCRNDFLAITGPNGGGKSTLLRIILKLLKPTRGTVTYHDMHGAQVDRLHIGYLPQKNMIDSRFPITVREVIASGLLGPHGSKLKDQDSLIEKTLDTVELRSHSESAIGTLSGGQLQRALLGRAIISGPNVLVLDEPLSYLDKNFEQHTYSILENIAPHTTILLVSHEMTTIASMASRHLIVDNTIHECSAHHHFIRTDSE